MTDSSTSPEPTVEIVEVSPELAETWLTRNTSNRNIRQAVVDAYSRDMTADSWLLNGESIKFDAAGNLRDGQHRLLGVIKSGQTVPLVVVRGLVGDIMPTIDARHEAHLRRRPPHRGRGEHRHPRRRH